MQNQGNLGGGGISQPIPLAAIRSGTYWIECEEARHAIARFGFLQLQTPF
jgi:hypothetical protein